jgi:hypothetical protein
MNQVKTSRTKTLTQYSRTVNEHGVMVRAKCVRIETTGGARYEILLDAAGQRAIVDVPGDPTTGLDQLVVTVAAGFAASVSLRLTEDGRLP